MKKILAAIALAALLSVTGCGGESNPMNPNLPGKSDEPTVTVTATTPEPEEDEPAFDCRVHGNQTCGVQIEGTWYTVTFGDGQPESVKLR